MVLAFGSGGGTSIATAVKIILALPRLEGCPWMFPSTKTDKPFVNFVAQWKPVLDRANIGHWRLHDLRHGFASAAIEFGAPLYIVGRQLGHARVSTTLAQSHAAARRQRRGRAENRSPSLKKIARYLSVIHATSAKFMRSAESWRS